MKQVVQDVKSGALTLETVPPPALLPGFVRVRTHASLISAGTERYVIDMARKSYLGKARSRPDLARQVWDRARRKGLMDTFQSVMSRLEKPLPLGYSASGVVEGVGEGVSGLSLGDRVAIAGAGYANHAEVNVVPRNLVAKIPGGVSFGAAAYTTVASIALQGLRLARPQLGEHVVVIGLGLVGLLTAHLLKAAGCRVLGIDLDPDKVASARDMGVEQAVGTSEAATAVDQFTRGHGADHVFVTAATESSAPIEQAGELSRLKGQVVVIGNVGLNVPRRVFFEKELALHVSMSYGPGRYDITYEEGGIDYPYDYVRWTEQRNMEAVLDMMADGRLMVEPLTTHRFPFAAAMDAYALITDQTAAPVGVMLEYQADQPQPAKVFLNTSAPQAQPHESLRVGFAGAGNYAALHLLPVLKAHPQVHLAGLATGTGLSAQKRGTQFGFDYCTTDYQALLTETDTDAVFIATRHATHAAFTQEALAAGKHVFVEKPMVTTPEQLASVQNAYLRANQERTTGLMVGLNRRFAPLMVQLKQFFPASAPLQMLYRVNAGPMLRKYWWHLPEEGGGTLVGEMCHFLDVMQHLAEARPIEVFARSLTLGSAQLADEDNLSIVVRFEKGSVGTLSYTTVGDKDAPKERLEVYGAGQVAHLDDFRTLHLTRDGRTKRHRGKGQDKGQKQMLSETIEAFRTTGRAPIPFQALFDAMQMVFAARASVQQGSAIQLPMDLPEAL